MTRYYVLIASLGLGIGCKVQNESKTKGVDAITSGNRDAAFGLSCGETKKDAQGTPGEQARDRIFDALPQPIKDYFGSAVTAIKLTHDAVGECGNIISVERDETVRKKMQDRLDAQKLCWGSAELTLAGKKLKIPHVVVQDDPLVLKAQLFSTLVYLYLTYFIDPLLEQQRLALSDDTDTGADDLTTASPANIKRALETFERLRSSLVRAVLADLVKLKPEASDKLIEHFKADFDNNLESSTPFANFIVSELAESHYCSLASSQQMKYDPFNEKTEKPKTWSGSTLDLINHMFRFLGQPQYKG